MTPANPFDLLRQLEQFKKLPGVRFVLWAIDRAALVVFAFAFIFVVSGIAFAAWAYVKLFGGV